MLHFFPSAFPDETLYSRLARYHRLSGHSDDRASLKELVGLHTHVVTSDLPSMLQTLVSRIPSMARSSAEELIHANTIFPYFKAFLPDERRDRAIEMMSSASTSGLKMALGLVASRLGGKNVFRFCRSCLHDDASSFGQAYWHRLHQLPGAWVCPVHSEAVCELNVSVAKLKRHKLFLPDDQLVTMNSIAISLSKSQTEAVQRVSILSNGLLMGKESYSSLWALNDLHRANAARNGLIRRNGRIRVVELADMLARYALSFPTFGEYAILCDSVQEWALRLLRKPRGSALHPMKHILLMDCLRGESPACTNGGTTHARTECGKEPKRRQIDEARLTEMLLEKKLTLTRVAAELGLSVTTVGVAAERLGLAIRGRRPKSLTDDVKERVCQSLRNGLAPREVAKTYNLSLVSIYRILRMDKTLATKCAGERFRQRRDEYRKRFSSPERSRADYSWLRRHDREWLAEQQATSEKNDVNRKPCADWAERDKCWAQQVVEVSESMRRLPGKPKWISRAALERAVAKAETIERNAEKLPLTHGALSSCAESLEECQRRRLCWAASELQKQRTGTPQRWQLLRVAGIRRLVQGNQDLLETLAYSLAKI